VSSHRQFDQALSMLPQRQLDTFLAVRRLTKQGRGPTLHELAEALGISRVTVHGHVHALADKGLVIPPGDTGPSGMGTRPVSASSYGRDPLAPLMAAWHQASATTRREFLHRIGARP